MKTIWKYPLGITDSQVLLVPAGAKFLSVIEQGDIPMLYALVDPGLPQGPTKVLIIGTGGPFDEALLQSHVFLGTVETHGKRLVWHVFVPKGSRYQEDS